MDTTYAYLAGAMDADGFFTIKKSTYQLRVTHDAVNPVYSERVGLKQVSPEVPDLLIQCFGGGRANQKASSPNGKPLFGYNATDQRAVALCRAVLPYLRVKRAQVEALLELRSWRDNSDAHRFAWWWEQENSDWQNFQMLTREEVAIRLRYAGPEMCGQALRNRTLLALPNTHNGHVYQARFPEPLVDALSHLYEHRPTGARKYVSPPQLIAKYENLYQTVREMNRIGIGKHPVSERSGVFAPIGRPN
ncbi:MAG: hypothetical protein V2A73_11830 [Pseudomonadota bacterium]